MLSTKEEVERRFAICQACPFSKHGMLGLTCGDLLKETEETCGCICKSKARFKNQRCKIGKWDQKQTH